MQSLNSDYVPSYSNSYASYNTNKIIKDIKESNFESNLNSISNVKSAYDTPTKYGFNVDSKGFFGADFNKAAGIPQNVKIHIKTMEQVDTYAKNTNSNFDSLQAINKIWNFFTNITGNIVETNEFLDGDQIDNLPKGYISFDGTLFGRSKGISRRESDQGMTFDSLTDGKLNAGTFPFINSISGSKEDIHNVREALTGQWGTGTTFYDNPPVDKLSVGEMFAFFMTHEPNFYPNGRAESVKNYYDFLKSGKSLEQYMSQSDPDFRTRKIAAYTGTDIDTAGRAFDELLKILDEYSKKFYDLHKRFIDDFLAGKENALKAEFPAKNLAFEISHL